jgi:hypothetical protein
MAEPLPELTCAGPDCDVRFVPKRSTARFHSDTCRRRAGRGGRKAKDPAALPDDPDEHDLVKAVRAELEKHEAVSTVSGQLALQLARRAANPMDPGLVALSKELDARMAAAIGKQPAAPVGDEAAGAAEPEDDEVRKARAKRDAKRAAASEA